MSEIVKILMERDKFTLEEAEEELKQLKQRVLEGENPEELLADELGLEPDYIEELL
jgi:hypothetical protein